MELQEDQSIIELEQGQLDKSKLKVLYPIYGLSINNDFYRNFVASTQKIQGDEKQKYDHMKNRIDKFFTYKSQFQRGYRWNKRIEPDYERENKQIFPLSHAVLIYGVDYLSNKEIKKILNISQQQKIVKRLNLSNVVINFHSKNHLEQVIGPFIFDNPNIPFFLPKQEDGLQQQEEDVKPALPNLQNLPKLWYGLKPYQYKDQPMYWFIRYLTNRQFIKIPQIKEKIQFRQIYDTGNKIFQQKKRIKQEVQNSERNSSYQVLSRSQSNFSSHYLKDRESNRDHIPSNKSSNIQQEHPQQIYNSNVNSIILQAQRSDILQLSFALGPQTKLQSQHILNLMNNMQLGQNKPLTLSNFNQLQEQEENQMQIVTRGSDPQGLYEKIHYQKVKPIHQLTEVKPNQVWRYSQYKEKILQAEEQLRNSKIIPIIVID